MKIDQGFLPILGRCPEILILGSMPGVRSLDDQQYYAHPRNVFWWIMSELFNFDVNAPYSERSAFLKQAKIAVWDVIHSCHRPGSLDSAIDQDSMQVNDFSSLFGSASLRLIAFNGQAAHKLFNKYVSDIFDGDMIVMPSTSPANAAMSRETKLEKWQSLKSYLQPDISESQRCF